MEYWRKTALTLERQRKRLLLVGAVLTLHLRASSPPLAPIVIADCFYIERKSNLTLGEEYLEAEIAEKSAVTNQIRLSDAQLNKIVTAEYAGARYNAAAVADIVTAARTFKIRLTPLSGKNT